MNFIRADVRGSPLRVRWSCLGRGLTSAVDWSRVRIGYGAACCVVFSTTCRKTEEPVVTWSNLQMMWEITAVIASLNEVIFAVNVRFSLAYIVKLNNELIVHQQQSTRPCCYRQPFSCMFSIHQHIRITRITRETNARRRAVPCVVLRCVAAPDPVWTRLNDFKGSRAAANSWLSDWLMRTFCASYHYQMHARRPTSAEMRGGEARRGRRDSAAVIVYRFLLVSGVQLQWSQLSHAFFHQSQLYAADDV